MKPSTHRLQDMLREAGPRPGPDWLETLSRRDRSRFLRHGLPHKRLEDWKYTPLDGLAGASLVGDVPETSPPVDRGLAPDGATILDLVDGMPVGALPAGPDGVEWLTLADALAADDGDLRDRIEALDTEHPSRAMAALNTADLGRGLVLRVADGVAAGCLALRWRSADPEADRLVNARVLVSLGAGARLDLVEEYATTGALNVVHQLDLGADSRLRHARLQDSAASSWLITRTELSQAQNSAFEQVSLDLGGGLARHDLRNRLAAPGAACALSGAYLPAGQAHVDHHLDVRHEAPGCRSEQVFRGVLHDHGHAVFNGRVHVLPGADDTEARQSNQNLLLSREAEVDTKPELIIEADEVIASHGATVGQLDEKAVFYLRSRGIPEAAARRMLTAAFCRAVVEGMGIDAARAAFLERLDRFLEERT